MCQDEELVPAPLWGLSSCCRPADWILNLNGQQNARRGLPHILQKHEVNGRAAQKSSVFLFIYLFIFPKSSLAAPTLQSRCDSFLTLSPFFDKQAEYCSFCNIKVERRFFFFFSLLLLLTEHVCPPRFLNFTFRSPDS